MLIFTVKKCMVIIILTKVAQLLLFSCFQFTLKHQHQYKEKENMYKLRQRIKIPIFFLGNSQGYTTDLVSKPITSERREMPLYIWEKIIYTRTLPQWVPKVEIYQIWLHANNMTWQNHGLGLTDTHDQPWTMSWWGHHVNQMLENLIPRPHN